MTTDGTQVPSEDNQGSILVVDDTHANLHLLVDILTSAHYNVRPAPDGRMALASVHNKEPDLILLDVQMPGMNGYEVCETLKKEEATRDIPVIFITAQTEIQNKLAGFAAGGQDYITKPFAPEEVLARVRTHMELRRTQRNLARSLERLEKAQDVMERELDMARRIQESLLPLTPPRVTGVEINSRYIALQEVGGDFIDYYVERGRSALGILVADASGHGVPAALVGSMAKMALEGMRALLHKPLELLTQLNEALMNKTSGNFVTAVYGVYEAGENGESIYRYATAGHPPPFLIRDGQINQLEGRGSVLGLLNSLRLTEREIALKPGDRLLIVTDGILECRRPDDELLDSDMLCEMLKEPAHISGGELLDRLLAKVHTFMDGTGFDDDVTLVLLDVKENPGGHIESL